MSSGKREKGGDTNNPFEYNYNTGMGESSKWKMAPQKIISVVTSKTQYGNLTDSGANILTSGTYGRQCSEYYVGMNAVLDMMDSVNPNAVSLHSADFAILIYPNVDKNDRYIGIVSTMI